ncbi:DUF1566 domain-containing protein [Ralstonia mojiangensis]|uniref:Lcl domain-containing protein n=1 Tax=Ralstonia mojiangensis TaxID=2953895 RepID=UPI003B75BF83
MSFIKRSRLRIFTLWSVVCVLVAGCGESHSGEARKGGLTWTQVSSEIRGTWPEANNYCTTHRFNGTDSWRLPSRAELITALSGRVGNFPWGRTEVDWLWSSTEREPGSHYLVNINNASSSWPEDSRVAWIVCVR